MFKSINKHWQYAFEMAWDAYKCDTIPIGAIIVDKAGDIVSTGKNRIYDESSSHPLAGTVMAHAEMTAMMALKHEDHPDVRDYTLYTTMEPCPMCFGTMLMVHITDLRFAAYDDFAGATELKDKSWYLNQKKMKIENNADLAEFQIVMQTAFEHKRNHKYKNRIIDRWAFKYKEAVRLGGILHSEHFFDQAIEDNLSLEVVFDTVMERLND